jgi:hypothetical protein
MNQRWRGFGLLLLVGGCAPISPPTPFHFAETAEILPRGTVAATAAGGIGNLANMGSGLGLGARGRFGLGGRQELETEGVLIGIFNGDKPTPQQPWKGNTTMGATKVAWRIGATPWLALSTGIGVSFSATGTAIGGDLAAVISQPSPSGNWDPYFGVRGAVAVPVGRDTNEAGGITEGLVVAAGTMYRLTPRARLAFELGYLGTWASGYLSTALDSTRQIQDQHRDGAYLAAALELRFSE